MTLRVLSLFSGIGAFEKALTNLNVDFEVVAFCELDKYAAKSYCTIHNIEPKKNLVDVTKIDTSKLHDIDLITYGFPCQDISQAGTQKGFTDEKGNVTRSGLFFEALRIIRDLQPRYAIAENVKALTSKRFEREFELVKESLNQVGYNNYSKVLNAVDFNIPQNRERLFIVSVRKDIDDYSFQFPVGGVLTNFLVDFLEDEVEEKYYKSDDRTARFLSKIEAERRKIKQIGNIREDSAWSNAQTGRIYDADYIAPTLNCCEGGDRQIKILCRGCEKCQF